MGEIIKIIVKYKAIIQQTFLMEIDENAKFEKKKKIAQYFKF